MIGKISFSLPEWKGAGLRLRGEKGYEVEFFHTPRNCSQLTMGCITGAADIQNFIAENMCVGNNFRVVTASAAPHLAKKFIKLGWKSCGVYNARFSDQMEYLIKEFNNDALKQGYGGTITHSAITVLK